MSNIDAFKAGLTLIGAATSKSIPSLLEAAAEDLAAAMRDKAELHRKSGATVASVQVVKTKNPNRIRVQAGGDLTTKEIRKGSGKSYDYAMAEEFGTKDETAIPFFYPTYRAKKAEIVARVTDGAAKTID